MKKAGKEVGILTCFNEEFVNEIFNEYFYNFEENQRESFSLELITSELKLRKD